MTVYLVTSGDEWGGGTSVHAIYTTRELADEHAARDGYDVEVWGVLSELVPPPPVHQCTEGCRHVQETTSTALSAITEDAGMLMAYAIDTVLSASLTRKDKP